MDTRALEELGLTPGEIKVYLALTKLGETTTGPLVDESHVSVSKVYQILDRLSRKGLSSHIVKKGIKYFKSADPNRLLDYLKEKERNLEKQEINLKEIIPQLAEIKGTAITEETAQVYDGLKGIQTAR